MFSKGLGYSQMQNKDIDKYTHSESTNVNGNGNGNSKTDDTVAAQAAGFGAKQQEQYDDIDIDLDKYMVSPNQKNNAQHSKNIDDPFTQIQAPCQQQFNSNHTSTFGSFGGSINPKNTFINTNISNSQTIPQQQFKPNPNSAFSFGGFGSNSSNSKTLWNSTTQNSQPILSQQQFNQNPNSTFSFGGFGSNPKSTQFSVTQNSQPFPQQLPLNQNSVFSFGVFGNSKPFETSQQQVNQQKKPFMFKPPCIKQPLNPPINNNIGFGSYAKNNLFENLNNDGSFKNPSNSNLNTISIQPKKLLFGGTTTSSSQNSINKQPLFGSNSSQQNVPFGSVQAFGSISQSKKMPSQQNQYFAPKQVPLGNLKKVEHILKSINQNQNFSLNIKQLKLSNCKIQDEGLKQMINGVKWPILGKLYLSVNHITDISCLTEQNIPSITWLTLMYNKLGLQACKFLGSRKWKTLQKLSISFSKQGKQCITKLLGCFEQKFENLNTLWIIIPSQSPFGQSYLNQLMQKRSGNLYCYSQNGWIAQERIYSPIPNEKDTQKYNNLIENNKKKLDLYIASMGKKLSLYEDKKNVTFWNQPYHQPPPLVWSDLNQQLIKKSEQQLKAEQTFKFVEKLQKWMKIAQQLYTFGLVLLSSSEIEKASQSLANAIQIARKVIQQKQHYYRQRFKKNLNDTLLVSSPLNQILQKQIKKLKGTFCNLEAHHLENFSDNVDSIQKFIDHAQKKHIQELAPKEIQIQKIIRSAVYSQKSSLICYLRSFAKALQLNNKKAQALQSYYELKQLTQVVMKTPYQIMLFTSNKPFSGFGFNLDPSFGSNQNSSKKLFNQSVQATSGQFFLQKEYVLALKRIQKLLKGQKSQQSYQKLEKIEELLDGLE